MRAITVTIGQGNPTSRNYLSSDRWHSFKVRLVDFIVRAGFTPIVQNEGIGAWDGVAEVNFVVIGLAAGDFAANAHRVRYGLSLLADQFGQDAIAFGDYSSELIGDDHARFAAALDQHEHELAEANKTFEPGREHARIDRDANLAVTSVAASVDASRA